MTDPEQWEDFESALDRLIAYVVDDDAPETAFEAENRL